MAKHRAVLKGQIVRRQQKTRLSQSMSMKTRMIRTISPMSRSMSHADESESDDQTKVHHCPYSTKYSAVLCKVTSILTLERNHTHIKTNVDDALRNLVVIMFIC